MVFWRCAKLEPYFIGYAHGGGAQEVGITKLLLVSRLLPQVLNPS